jgi:hypothetical protein
MAYVVNITSRAERDLAHLYRKINAEYSDLALKWYRGLKGAHSQPGGATESMPCNAEE